MEVGAFSRRPILDRVFVQVTPLEEVFEQGAVAVDLQNDNINLRSDRGVVLAVGADVSEVKPGDTVFFDEFAYAGQFYLKPSDKYKTDLPTYLEIRLGDLRGVETVHASISSSSAEKYYCPIHNAVLCGSEEIQKHLYCAVEKQHA